MKSLNFYKNKIFSGIGQNLFTSTEIFPGTGEMHKWSCPVSECPFLYLYMAHNSRREVKKIDSNCITSNDEDDLHFNITGINLLLTEINKHVEGFKRREAAVQKYRYSEVSSEYPWGCQRRTGRRHICNKKQK